MFQEIEATFEDGVFKPDQHPSLSEHTRVRLLVEAVEESDKTSQEALTDLEQLWQNSRFDSQGDRLTRDQLHERR